jgi:1-acyl-sn-glycerol-3-phosphate acyltransferase
MDALGRDRKQVVAKAVSYLQKGESVYIFPEGVFKTQETLMSFKRGIAEIYLSHPCPVIPIGLIAPKRRVKNKMSRTAGRTMTVVSRNYYANIGKPMEFKAALSLAEVDRDKACQSILDELGIRIEALIREIKTDKFWS